MVFVITIKQHFALLEGIWTEFYPTSALVLWVDFCSSWGFGRRLDWSSRPWWLLLLFWELDCAGLCVAILWILLFSAFAFLWFVLCSSFSLFLVCYICDFFLSGGLVWTRLLALLGPTFSLYLCCTWATFWHSAPGLPATSPFGEQWV